jgi:prepilin-type N-terminal cleavage/methylation domain-containing protein
VVPQTGQDGEAGMTMLERMVAIAVLAAIWTLLPV